MSTSSELRLACFYNPQMEREATRYTAYLSSLLGHPFEMESNAAMRPVQNCDLLMYYYAGSSWWHSWLDYITAIRNLGTTAGSVLVSRAGATPLKRILLILRGEPADQFALEWVERLALPAKAEVFILPIFPPIPILYQHGGMYDDVLFQANLIIENESYIGQTVRKIENALKGRGIEKTLVLHDGKPNRRIDWAVDTFSIDLIIIGDEVSSRIERFIFGELVRPLIRFTPKPVLIARAPE